jgi:hypothetical protein
MLMSFQTNYKPTPILVSEGIKRYSHDDTETHSPTDLPEERLRFRGIDYPLEVHSVIASEEGKGQEDNCDTSEDENGFVLDVRHNGKLILFNGSKLEKLRKVVLGRSNAKENFLGDVPR